LPPAEGAPPGDVEEEAGNWTYIALTMGFNELAKHGRAQLRDALLHEGDGIALYVLLQAPALTACV
jgi:hypothetical protein